MTEAFTLEPTLKRLEENAEKMSQPEIPLEDSIRIYAESVKLIAQCQESLEKAKLKIDTLEVDPSHAAEKNGEGHTN